MIYEVNLSIDVEVIERFDEWLHWHIEEMLAIPGFISAAITVPDVEDENKVHRCVQYRLSGKKELDNYFEHHAEEMRAKSLQFDGQFTARRRVLSVAEAALAKHQACANCNAELSGRFCSVCGQREEPRVPTIGTVSGEFANEVFVVESKLWRSFHLLLFKPGQLTVAYLSGKRQQYMSPIRLYLLFSIAAFAYFALLNSHGESGVENRAATRIEVSEALAGQAVEPLQQDNVVFKSGLFSDEVDAQIGRKINSALTSIRNDAASGNEEAIVSKFLKPLPKALLLFLPIIALLFKILYLGSGKYYVEHLIYILHNHAFLFAVIVITGVTTQVAEAWPQFEILFALGLLFGLSVYAYRYMRKFLIGKYSKSRVKACLYLGSVVALLALLIDSVMTQGLGALIAILWLLYVPFYIYRSMRLVYQRPRWTTVFSLLLISMMYLFLLALMLLGSAVFVGFTYS